jgi:cobalt-zinc-cadmium efflux system membrane fusion protein
VREVRARFPGVVRSVSKAQGDTVRIGETLATVESDESLQTYAITAPMVGVITSRDANPGERSDSDPLFVITDVSSLWAELSVFPRDRARIRVGQSVHVRAADGGLEADAKLLRVDVVGGANQAVTARAALDNSQARWTPGLYVVADVVVDQTPAAVTIPRSAIQHFENRETAFVRTPAGFEPRALRLGRKDSDKIEVLEGIAAGEPVAQTNTYLIVSELAKPEPEE